MSGGSLRDRINAVTGRAGAAPSLRDRINAVRGTASAEPQVGVTLEVLDAAAAARGEKVVPYQPPPAPKAWWETLLESKPRATDSRGKPVFGGSEQAQQEGLDTLSDVGVAGAQGATLNFGDELAGIAMGNDARDAVRNRVAQAHERSPVAAGAAELGGSLLPSLAVPGAGAARAIGIAAGTGGLSAAGAADSDDLAAIRYDEGNGLSLGERAKAGLIGTAAGAGTAGVLRAGGALAQPLAKNAGKLVDLGLSGLGAYEGYKVGGVGGALIGASVGSNTRAGKLIGRFAPKALERGAGAVGRGLDAIAMPAGVGVGQALQTEKPSTVANTMPQVALQEAAAGGDAFGEFAGEFAEAAAKEQNEPGAMSALITRLTMSNPRFRATVLPQLRKAAGGGD